MADWHGYVGFENLDLTEAQRNTLFQNLVDDMPPPPDYPQPCHLGHWRVRLDNEAAIFESLFPESVPTVAQFKAYLGAIFGVDPEDIDHNSAFFQFGDYTTRVVTFSYLGTDKLRAALFGDVGADWEESRNEVVGYLLANLEDWEPPAEP